MMKQVIRFLTIQTLPPKCEHDKRLDIRRIYNIPYWIIMPRANIKNKIKLRDGVLSTHCFS